MVNSFYFLLGRSIDFSFFFLKTNRAPTTSTLNNLKDRFANRLFFAIHSIFLEFIYIFNFFGIYISPKDSPICDDVRTYCKKNSFHYLFAICNSREALSRFKRSKFYVTGYKWIACDFFMQRMSNFR